MKNYITNPKSCPILFEFVNWAEKHANYECGDAQRKLLSSNYKLFDLELNKYITSPILNGSTMIFSKK